ncbi:MAG: hypothetical protein COV31_01215 [Candidatus Yanofskybacteria bacterium CG10_big_fil_rev_8_21_14_0_10_46_23]|uniref:ATP-dependent Clp protease proteolytic subunit n=1 Tax=Candidatus Yanofskybacteria bacterium CG10_big_fil_rev_8_21_14_0_10_46_23 TaxID=1975098 RepID=A0A2H0R4P3_9BACT|nr:MAG: hypothetical protein COV31_01215 [Candidatus Yanofskybacteria bacterium CG10_big_fil_rev_8_21_14_0_10_46_23]
MSKKLSAFPCVPRRIISYFGEINFETAGEFLEKARQLDQENNDPITILIDLNGGIVRSSRAIFETLTTVIKSPIQTVITGSAESCGVIIFLSGQRRWISPGARMLFHPITTGTTRGLNIGDLKHYIRELDRDSSWMSRLVCRKSRLKKSKVKKLIFEPGEKVLSEKEILKSKLAHGYWPKQR